MARKFNSPQYYWDIAEEYISKKSKSIIGTDYYLDEKLAMKCIKFSSMLKHTSGEFAGANFQFQEWQIESIVDIFGTKYRDGIHKNLRLIQKVLFFMPKKNGKSEFAGLFHAIMFFIDGEKAKEQYSIATEVEQAKIIHKVFLTMLKQESELFDMVKSTIKPPRITKEDGAFFDEFISLTSSADTKDGLRPSLISVDEGHAFKSKELYQIMSDGLAGRNEPLEIHLSTAGYNMQGFFYLDIYQYARKVKRGIIKDERFYPVLFEPTDEEIKADNWQDREVWKRVNPNIGNSPTWSYMEGKVAQALESEQSLRAFKTKHLNMWVDKAEVWIKNDVWLNDETFNLEDFRGCKCNYGLDLATVMDLNCLTLQFEKDDKLYIFQKYYMPEENLSARVKGDRVPYYDWVKKGFITTTPGTRSDHDYIFRDIIKLNSEYPCELLGYDDWNSNYLISKLEEEGINTIPIRQGLKTLSPATKELETKAIEKKIIHNNNPVLSWCVSNVVLKVDSSENYMPDKAKSIERIDGVASLNNCIALYILNRTEEKTNPYQTRGLRSL